MDRPPLPHDDGSQPAKRARLEDGGDGGGGAPAPPGVAAPAPPSMGAPLEEAAAPPVAEAALGGAIDAPAPPPAEPANDAPPAPPPPYRPALLGPLPPGVRFNGSLLEDVLTMGDGYIRGEVFDCLWQGEVLGLRAASRMCREAVAEHPWSDFDEQRLFVKSRIRGRLSSWRACFPNARAANIYGNLTITDADFVHLRGIHTLNMSYCYQVTISDAAFAHLRGIHTLDISYCGQATITDAAFAHLRGIHTLNMSY